MTCPKPSSAFLGAGASTRIPPTSTWFRTAHAGIKDVSVQFVTGTRVLVFDFAVRRPPLDPLRYRIVDECTARTHGRSHQIVGSCL